MLAYVAISRTTFEFSFSSMKIVMFYWNFTKACSRGGPIYNGLATSQYLNQQWPGLQTHVHNAPFSIKEIISPWWARSGSIWSIWNVSRNTAKSCVIRERNRHKSSEMSIKFQGGAISKTQSCPWLHWKLSFYLFRAADAKDFAEITKCTFHCTIIQPFKCLSNQTGPTFTNMFNFNPSMDK